MRRASLVEFMAFFLSASRNHEGFVDFQPFKLRTASA